MFDVSVNQLSTLGADGSHGMACMSLPVKVSAPHTDLALLEKLIFNLSMDPNTREFNCTLRWLIYQIVKANKGITYVKLKQILRGEYGIDKKLMDTAISSMTSTSLFNCLTKWRNPRMKDVGAEVGIHLSVREVESETFTMWKTQITAEFPELSQFRAPVISPRNEANHNRKSR